MIIQINIAQVIVLKERLYVIIVIRDTFDSTPCVQQWAVNSHLQYTVTKDETLMLVTFSN